MTYICSNLHLRRPMKTQPTGFPRRLSWNRRTPLGSLRTTYLDSLFTMSRPLSSKQCSPTLSKLGLGDSEFELGQEDIWNRFSVGPFSELSDEANFLKVQFMLRFRTSTWCDVMLVPRSGGDPFILILCQLQQTDEDIPQSFMQNFVLKPANDSFFIQHDVFR